MHAAILRCAEFSTWSRVNPMSRKHEAAKTADKALQEAQSRHDETARRSAQGRRGSSDDRFARLALAASICSA